MDPAVDAGGTSGTASAPVRVGERIGTIDVLRGIALLGILVMNIPTFSLAAASMMDPTIAGGFDGANKAVWLGSHLVFDFKMMSIFSMLFGAGIVLMSDRAAARGRSVAGLHYRRMGVLLGIGMLHAYLVWFGDILVPYAMLGMILYPIRRLHPKWLITLAIVSLVIGMLVTTLMGLGMGYVRDQALASPDGEMGKAWEEMAADFSPSPEQLEEERAVHVGSYWGLFVHRAPTVFWMQAFMFPFLFAWRVGATMLIGMALCRWRVFDGSRPARFNLTLVALGYGLGFPLIYWGYLHRSANDFDVIDLFIVGWHFNNVGSVLVALGHVGLIMLLCNAIGIAKGLFRWLGDVGRMAFTNYLTQSLICAALFYGWGFGLWGQLDRVQLIGVVAVIWCVQLVWSRLWLTRFRFGPMEWAWRSMSYLKLQPIVRPPASEMPAPGGGGGGTPPATG